MRQLSLIIPTFDEEERIGACLRSVAPLDAEVIVVDGGSRDATVAIAADHGARTITTRRGRGAQLRAGAEAATGANLFFLHADSVLAPEAIPAIERAVVDPCFTVGKLRLRFDTPHPLYALYARLARIESFWTSFGDQGIVIRRDLYELLGGFPDWPLLEDVELLRRARRAGGIRLIPADIVTSARRFRRHGIVRQQILNGVVLTRYLLGTSPEELEALYAGGRIVPGLRRRGRFPDVPYRA